MELNDITFEDIKKVADSPAIVERGKAYYNQGKVKFVESNNDRLIAMVKGNYGNYRVEIFIEDGVIDSECSCPYDGHGCKHIVAAMYKWLLEMQNNNTPKKNNSTALNYLTFKNIAEATTQNKLSEAFEILNANNAAIKYHGAKKISATVNDGPQYLVNIEQPEYRWGGNEFQGHCSCSPNSFSSNCTHVISVLLSTLKTKKPKEIPKGFEKRLKEKIQKEKFLLLKGKLENAFSPSPHEIERKYKIFFGIEKELNGISVSIKKAQVLKSGVLGTPSTVTPAFLKKTYKDFSNAKKIAIGLALNIAKFQPYYFHPSRSNIMIKEEEFENPLVTDLLSSLRQLYCQEPDCFADCHFPQEKALTQICLEQKNDNYLFRVVAKLNGNIFDLNKKETMVLGEHPLWAFTGKQGNENTELKSACFELQAFDPMMVKSLLNHSGTEIKSSKMNDFIEKYYADLRNVCTIVLPDNYEIKEISEVLPKPRLFLKNYLDHFSIELRFLYMDKEIEYKNNHDIIFKDDNNKIVSIKRNRETEKKFFLMLIENNSIEKNGFLVPAVNPLDWLTETAPALISSGFEIFGQDQLVNQKINPAKPELKLEVSSGIDWFDLKAEADFGGQKIGFEKLVSTLNRGERFIKLSDGSLGVIPNKWVAKLAGVTGLLKKEKDSFKAASTQILLVEELLDIAKEAKVDQKFDEIRNKFRQFKKIKNIPLPKNINGELRDYQKAGYDWLHFLKDFSFGGCLADEMGLGKTLQILALLLYEKEKGNNTPSLIVVPKSLVFNWELEVNKFTPSLNIYIHHGKERIKQTSKIYSKKPDLIITTYSTLRNDLNLFKEKLFHYIVLDESQQIKNPLAKNTKSVYALKSNHRLIMTGTPIENNSMELWSQFAFINPGLLGNMDYFKRTFAKSIEQNKDKEKATALKSMINPFLLMRKKETVINDLPDKQIILNYCEMEKNQRKIYEQCREKFRNEINQAIEQKGFMNSKLKILEGLMRLRQICNHPVLYDESFTGESGKFNLLANQIEEVIKEGHKALVFSSFVKMLHIFKEHFTQKGIKYSYLDGKTMKRKEAVQEFQQNKEIPVFLMSLKAGGLGLNLTAADYVFIVDPWWNPAAEMQAIDRTHRIGQKNKVFVYKAITKDSVEEKILQLQEKKLELVKNVITVEEGIFKKLSRKDINSLFQ